MARNPQNDILATVTFNMTSGGAYTVAESEVRKAGGYEEFLQSEGYSLADVEGRIQVGTLTRAELEALPEFQP